MEHQRLTLQGAPAQQVKDLDGILAQIAEAVARATAAGNGDAVEAAGLTVVCMVFRQPLPSSTAEGGVGRGLPDLALAGSEEWPAPDQFAWAFEDSRNMRTLKRFFLMGWAYRHGARSLRDVLRKLWPQRQRFGAENVPASTKDYSDCAREITAHFKDLPHLKGAEEVELFVRKGEKPPFTDAGHQDTRAIIGLTEAGWQAWAETGRFLAIHGGPGPWGATNGVR